jgi:hypothetical protein
VVLPHSNEIEGLLVVDKLDFYLTAMRSRASWLLTNSMYCHLMVLPHSNEIKGLLVGDKLDVLPPDGLTSQQ